MTPPPGWYRDPHAPHLERWWDGTSWTGHRRTPGAPAVPPAPSADGTGRARAIALTTAGAVLVAAVVTGAVLLGGDGREPGTRTAATSTTSAPEPPPPSASEPSAGDPDVVEDQLNGITFPLLDGWVRPENVAQDDVVMTTDGTYDCPGDGSVCRHGLVISRTVTENDETSPEALAEEDISEAADAAFDEDALGRRPYGGLESHEVVKAGPVAVAGRAGYFVRWRVTTAEGPGGYVQSLVFPSSVGTGAPVLVRYVFDAGQDGPPPADMDRITEGIRPVTDPASGGGVGSSIGPAD
ncbi:hypothetical protein ADK41_02400 [Streptomyces caelestis]|uniref:DUF2510 domain-containing protein n=1 Tax=Streptomyces caelestis TaxID=36816 RepID=A0A0M8QMZ0_9ACTN|nr:MULTISPECIES: DUF2510 domain-containing protein [Streptomyces]KOT46580.1 hypothetical protein ADK41_02400 [Streptomyces caelestis]